MTRYAYWPRRLAISAMQQARRPAENCCLYGCLGWWRAGAVETVEEGLHDDTDLFVVAVDGGPGLGFADHTRAADPGQDGAMTLVAEREQGGDDAGCGGGR